MLRTRHRGGPKTCCLSLLVVVACGAPAELDEGRFPRPDATGYVDGQISAGSAANNGGSPPVGQGGSGLVGGGGSTALQGGSGGAPPAGGGTSGGSSSQAGNTQSGGDSGASGADSAGGCPEDITEIFAKNIAQGGCTNAGGCHETGGPIAPDLVSPNVAARLLNVASRCTVSSDGMTLPARPYIGAEDSFLEEKIAGTPDAKCGFSMPFLEPQNLSAADEQCIIDWIAEVAGGGG